MSLSSIDNAVPTTDNTIAPNIAGTQPSILRLGTTADTINKTTALITNENNPSVIIVIGRAISASTGFIKVLTTPKTMAARTAEVKLAT